MMDTQWSKNHQAMLDESWSMFQKISRLPALWQHAQRVKKGATPSEVVYEEDRLKVFHYLSDEPPRHKVPVIFVFALVNRPYILDLMPNKSVVKQFVDAGF